MSVLEIAKSRANLVSDRKDDFAQNLGCTLADFYGHYSPQDLHMRYANRASLVPCSVWWHAPRVPDWTWKSPI